MDPKLKKLMALNILVFISIIIQIRKIILLKLSKCTAVIHKTSHVLYTNALTLIYDAIIPSYINYCVEVWGNTHKTNLYSLFIKQGRDFFIVCHARYFDHTSRLLHEL